LTTLKKQSKRVAVNVWYRNTMRNIQTASWTPCTMDICIFEVARYIYGMKWRVEAMNKDHVYSEHLNQFVHIHSQKTGVNDRK
jgi:hypothetical protein